MKKYKGVNNLEEVIEKANKLGYKYKCVNHENRLVKGNLDICIRTFGKFLVYEDGNCIATEKSTELDNEEWYQEILDIIYISDTKCEEDGLTDEEELLWCDQQLFGGLDD